PYTTTAPALQGSDANGAWGTILSELLALRTADASSRYYYGVVKVSYSSGVAGLGYVGGSARTAMGWDYLPTGINIMAHEVGHNMGRLHAPCGGATGTDPAYPYAGGQIGVWGMDLSSLILKAPTVTDVMSYCGPNWISDFNWSAMVSFRQSGPNNAPAAGGSSAGLLIWGRITPSGVVLEPAFQVAAAAGTPPRPGSNRLELLAADGSTLQSVSFEATEVADLPGGREDHFAFVLPLSSGAQRGLAGLRVRAGSRIALRSSAAPAGADPAPQLSRPGAGQLELRWDGVRFPMALVRDAASGQILSFARGGAARLWAGGQAFDLQFSDGVRTVSLPARVLR
ncbi:MAG TPA: M66 family metalloprotease, partial [Gemmatimonadales bacterium]|nr:M66 family metalloprotease [Gemmatimonadales bacterium]